MKILSLSQEFEEWLEIADNLDIWETGKLSASEKRILVVLLGIRYSSVGSTTQEHFLRRQGAC